MNVCARSYAHTHTRTFDYVFMFLTVGKYKDINNKNWIVGSICGTLLLTQGVNLLVDQAEEMWRGNMKSQVIQAHFLFLNPLT